MVLNTARKNRMTFKTAQCHASLLLTVSEPIKPKMESTTIKPASVFILFHPFAEHRDIL